MPSSRKSNNMPYNEIINEGAPEGGAMALKSRLVRFRKWASKQAKITAHGAICIVNGEATDGVRNAPILTYEAPKPVPGSEGGGSGGGSAGGAKSEVRSGAIDKQVDRAMYDRSIGCQVRTVRELKKDEVALSIPPSAMVSPDLIAASDAGQAVFACCSSNQSEFWDAFSPTIKLEKLQAEKIQQNSGTQLLVKILQERKKVEAALSNAERMAAEAEDRGETLKLPNNLARAGSISYRAPFMAFLIHQRFANEQSPPVASSTRDITEDRTDMPENAPGTFAPYARTLPSSICLPICWKRNELALLAGCIPGMPSLQKVTARTMQLSTELMALMDAGLLRRFPSIFAPGMITWDRWVWAAAAYESRVFSTSSLPAWIWADAVSPVHVWESCGVMVPFLDMLNHEDKAAQVEWQMFPRKSSDRMDDSNDERTPGYDDADIQRLNVTTNARSKKHVQIYRDYGSLSNESFMMQYGFARMSNPFDKVRIAWSLVDGVGGVSPPADYEQSSDIDSVPSSFLVFESNDPDAVKSWWTEQRLSMLGKALMNNNESLDMLKKGKRVTFSAFNNGKIDFHIISVAIVATLPHERVLEWFEKSNSDTSNSAKPLIGATLDNNCQRAVRLYLSYLFTKKLEKLLQSLNSCLKNHFNSVQLWTKASSGGLNYASGSDGSSGGADGGETPSAVIGWQSFFDTYAYNSTMEVETRYYAMAPDSCVLTLYDGHVRSLQNSLDVMASDEVFFGKVGQHLDNLGCALVESDEMSGKMASQPTSVKMEIETEKVARKAEPQSTDAIKVANSSSPKKEAGNGSNGKGDRQKQVSKKGERPPAIKLHIGNLSYQTLPNELYDFFTTLYGKDSVLECHIPTERDTGNSRGFGFVTMPEEFAKAALEAGRAHEMNGRILKVAESNSAGTGKGSKGRAPAIASDRCPNCGYRPRWCTCNPNLGPMNMGPPPDSIYGPGPFMQPPMGGPGYGPPHEMDRRRDGYGWGGDMGGGGGGGWGHGRSYSRSPSYRRGRDRGYRSRSYSRSRSRSYSRGRDRKDRDRHRGRDRHDDRRRYGGSSREDDRRRGNAEEWDRDRSSRHSSRHYHSKSRSRSHSRQHDAGGSPGRRVDDGTGNFAAQAKGGRSRSRSRSPTDNAADRSSSSKKREGKDSSGRGGRSRSRERERGSRRRKRSKGSRRGKESSSSAKRRASRSRSRH